MITITKNKIISESNWKSKSIDIDKLLWIANTKKWYIAKAWIGAYLIWLFWITSRQAIEVADSLRPERETFYNLND